MKPDYFVIFIIIRALSHSLSDVERIKFRAKRADNTEKRKLIIFWSSLIPIYGLKVVKFEELKVKRLVTLQGKYYIHGNTK